MLVSVEAKSMNIREINIKFSTEEQCLAYIEQMKWPDGIVRCPTCGDTKITKYERPKTERKRATLRSLPRILTRSIVASGSTSAINPIVASSSAQRLARCSLTPICR